MLLWQKLKWVAKPRAEKQQLLERVVDVLRLDPATYGLYEEAVQDGLTIRFSAGLIGGRALGIFSVGPGHPKGMILLQPQENNDVLDLAETLAHELRHYWQHKKLGHSFMQRAEALVGQGEFSLVFNRLMEADAFAFQHRFRHIREGQAEWMRATANMLERAGRNGPLTQAAMERVNRSARQAWNSLQASAGRVMASVFKTQMLSFNLASAYDVAFARRIHALPLRKWEAIDGQGLSSPAIDAFRAVLRGEKLRPPTCLDLATKAEFNAAALPYIDWKARRVVQLKGEFNALRRWWHPGERKLRRNARDLLRQMR